MVLMSLAVGREQEVVTEDTFLYNFLGFGSFHLTPGLVNKVGGWGAMARVCRLRVIQRRSADLVRP